MTKIYLDNAATTPLLSEVREAMLPFLDDAFGNPSSLHQWGDPARDAVESARARVADDKEIKQDMPAWCKSVPPVHIL